MSDTKEDGATALLGCALMLVWFPFGVAWGAFVTMTVWNHWMPVAFALPLLTMRTALAVNVVKALATWGLTKRDKDAGVLEGVVGHIGNAVFGGLILIGASWAIHAVVY